MSRVGDGVMVRLVTVAGLEAVGTIPLCDSVLVIVEQVLSTALAHSGKILGVEVIFKAFELGKHIAVEVSGDWKKKASFEKFSSETLERYQPVVPFLYVETRRKSIASLK